MQQPPLYSQRMGAVSWQEPPDSARPGRGGQSLLARMAGRCSFRQRTAYRRLKAALAHTPLFDRHFYLQADPELAASGLDPLWHYCSRGIREGRNPNPYFFSSWYLASYPEVRRSGMNPLLHYLLHGREARYQPNPYFFTGWYLEQHPELPEDQHPLWHYMHEGAAAGCWPNPYFDPAWYRRTHQRANDLEPLAHFLAHGPQPSAHFDSTWYAQAYPQAARMGLHPFQHYLEYGAEEHCDPGPLFDSAWYAGTWPEAVAGGLLPLAHYLQHVDDPEVNPNPYFDKAWYLRQYPEIARNGLDPVLHYWIFGVQERRDPGPWFSTDWYLWRYADVAALAMNPLVHYLRIGAAQGREAGPYFDSAWYLRQCPDAARSGMPPLLHFLRLGQQAGMAPFDPREKGRRGNRYVAWSDLFFGLQEEDRALMRRHIGDFALKPLISVVMPVYNPEPAFLEAAIGSVQAQLYPHWELCIADDASTRPEIAGILRRYQQEDSRIRVLFRPENGHISRASNSALALAGGEFVALLDHDDELSEDALFWVVAALNRQPDAGIVYSDEDKIDSQGLRTKPYFKCDWDPWLFCGHNLITHLGVYRRALLTAIGGFRTGYEGSQDYDLAARAVERLSAAQIVHVPRVLYHWRMSAGSTAASVAEKPYARLAAQKAVSGHLARMGVPARASTDPAMGSVQQLLFQPMAEAPLVSILIPTRNGAELVRGCVDSIYEKTGYPAFEIVLVDNGSDDPAAVAYFSELERQGRVRLLVDKGAFNYSRLNNRAVAAARGEVVVLLNNDTEVIAPDWLHELTSLALLPQVGAVGAKLLYSNRHLQHAGVLLGMSGCAAHAYADFPEDAQGYCNLALLLRGYSAVTGACLAVRKAVYEAVGGLDEAALPVGYNDIDFCLKLRARGLRNLWTPRALLFHHESRSRGADSTPEKKARFWNEMSLLKKRWPNAWYHDPAYNPNLTLSKVDYDRSMQPRTLLNTRHWPSPFAAGYVAPKSSGLRLLLALPEKGPDSRPLAFARALLRQGLIQSYAAAHGSAFFEVSPEADGWFDALWLAAPPSGLMWFERSLMRCLPYVMDVTGLEAFARAPEPERDNRLFQSLVHAAALSTPDAAIVAGLERLYGLSLAGCSRVLAADSAPEDLLSCLDSVRLAEALPACRIRFF